MKLNRPKLIVGTGLLLLLSACDGSSSSSSTPPAATPAPVAAATPQAQISANFATDYNASNNSTPATPSQSDVGAPSLTGTPIALH